MGYFETIQYSGNNGLCWMTLNRIEAEEDNRSMRYDTIVEFNVDSKAEFDQAHETKTKNAVPVLDSLTNTEVD